MASEAIPKKLTEKLGMKEEEARSILEFQGAEETKAMGKWICLFKTERKCIRGKRKDERSRQNICVYQSCIKA